MSAHSVAQAVRFVLTEAGREALRDAETCHCTITFAGLLLVCEECGTVYGHFNQMQIGGYSRAKAD